jgi:Transposase IS116/IS110/IS902 family
VDLALIGYYDQVLNDLELTIVNTAKQHNAQTLYRLQSVPGIGKILALVLWYETHDIVRFPRVQDFVSYCRLGACPRINVFSLWSPGEPGSLCVQSDHAAETLSASDGHGQCPDGRPPGQGLLRVHRVPSHRMRP